MSRDPPQRRGAARETAVPLSPGGHWPGCRCAQRTARRRLRNGGCKPAVDVASWDGSPTGRRQPGWLRSRRTARTDTAGPEINEEQKEKPAETDG
jgi:hypothetical protein